MGKVVKGKMYEKQKIKEKCFVMMHVMKSIKIKYINVPIRKKKEKNWKKGLKGNKGVFFI